jgi:hypothetical protein
MRVTIIVAIIAAIGGYLHGRRATREELRILELYMEQLERIQREEL